MEESAKVGKALRRDAFQLARELYDDLKPQLDVLYEKMKREEIEIEKREKMKQKDEQDRLISRNRK